MPAILLLLVFGLGAGLSGVISPSDMLGDLLMPFISVSVAIILLEGGLSLKLSDITESGAAIPNLISIGAIATWTIAAFAGVYVLDLPLELSLLLGAVLVVSGPTVILPILRNVRPTKRVAAILRWEAIFIDPIGAMFAALVLDILISSRGGRAQTPLISALEMIGVGFAGGVLSGAFLQMILKRYLVPDFLKNPFVLMITVAAFVLSNEVAPDSGLFTVTILGIYLANQKSIEVHRILVFKEDLSVLLLSFLFILLAANLDIKALKEINTAAVVFVLILVFVARPVTVLISTLFTKLNWNERAFLSFMAPRGIVAAAIVAFFSFRLQAVGFEQSERLVPITFLVIVMTVVIYGLSANFVARLLKVAKAKPNGFLIVGAHPWARRIAKALMHYGAEVLMIDTNAESIAVAKQEGIPATLENILNPEVDNTIELSGIGRLLALTPNSEINALAAMHFNEVFGEKGVFQLQPLRTDKGIKTPYRRLARGRMLFDAGATYRNLQGLFDSGAKLAVFKPAKDMGLQQYYKRFGKRSFPLFVVERDGTISPVTVGDDFVIRAGNRIIHLHAPDKERKAHLFEGIVHDESIPGA